MDGRPLEGQVALVTGASTGIGRELAIGLAAHGAAVAVSFRSDAEGAAATCRAISVAGGRASSVQVDVRSPEGVRRLMEAVSHEFGRIDVLVNNAASMRVGPASALTEEDWDEVIDTNLKGPFFTSVLAAEAMRAGGGGSVVNISSCITGPMLPDQSVYTISKAGLEALTRVLALEFAPSVRVNAVAPGPTETERTRAEALDYAATWGRVLPMERVAGTDDLVGPVVFLASSASGFLTGEVLHVDGGWSLQGRTAAPDSG